MDVLNAFNKDNIANNLCIGDMCNNKCKIM